MMPRIAVLDAYDTVLCHMDNTRPKALHYYDDTFKRYLKGTASTFEFRCNARHEHSVNLVVGGKLVISIGAYGYYMNIVEVNRDEYEVEVTAHQCTLELINEQAGAYESSANTFEHFVKIFDPENTIEIGINEVSMYRRAVKWDGTESKLARLFSLATNFDAEIAFETIVNQHYGLDKVRMNVYREHSDDSQGIGKATGEILRVGKDIQSVRRTTDITDLYTAITPTGKDGLTLKNLEKYEYNKDGELEYYTPKFTESILAPLARDKYPSNLSTATERYITVPWSYDTDNVNVLYGQALAELKKNSVPKVSYEVYDRVDGEIGNTYTIVDDLFNPPLYVSARITEQEVSFTDAAKGKTTFDNFTELKSQIPDDILDRVKALEARKQYTTALTSTNGTIFKNNTGATTLEVVTLETDEEEFSYRWYVNGREVE